jgi:hypothetical protein
MRRVVSVMAALLSIVVPASASPFVPYLGAMESDLEALSDSFC